jgi:hypothetical protein
MTPPHTESLHGSHLLDTNSYSFADTPHVAKTRFARDSLQTDIPTLEGPSHLQNLRTTYVASYDDENVPNSTRMRRAKSLALALLQHYYPKSDGYFIRPSNLGPVAKYGLNFMIKGKDGHDPPFKGLPYLKKGKSKLSPANQAEREKKRQYKHNSAFFLTVEWHFIEPGDITGFEILKKTTVLDGDIKKEEYLPYTYLAIMIDNLQNFPFADINDIHRGDILTDVLCYAKSFALDTASFSSARASSSTISIMETIVGLAPILTRILRSVLMSHVSRYVRTWRAGISWWICGRWAWIWWMGCSRMSWLRTLSTGTRSLRLETTWLMGKMLVENMWKAIWLCRTSLREVKT